MGRQLRSELKILTALPVAQLRSRADDLARQIRELDARIQQSNWQFDLLEHSPARRTGDRARHTAHHHLQIRSDEGGKGNSPGRQRHTQQRWQPSVLVTGIRRWYLTV
jgi:hypothetical protein